MNAKGKSGRAKAKRVPPEKPSFSVQLSRIEHIVRTLEDEDLDLDRAIELFQEGVENLKAARSLLREAELTVQSVIKAADGTIRGRDLD